MCVGGGGLGVDLIIVCMQINIVSSPGHSQFYFVETGSGLGTRLLASISCFKGII